MRTQSTDTHAEAETVLIDLIRKAKPHEKFAQVRSLSCTVAKMSRRAISRKNPHLGADELRSLFVHHQYGQELGSQFEQYLKNRPHG